ncbi:MAG: histidine kinase [Bacteroidota bacterium]
MKRIEHHSVLAMLLQNSWLQHLLFWSLSLVVLLHLFAYEDQWYKVDYIYTSLFHLSLLLVVYLQIKVLIPHFLQQNKYLLYLLLLGLVLLAGTLLNELTFNVLSDILFPDYYFISYYSFANIFLFMLIYSAISGLLKLSKGWFRLQVAEQQLARLREEKVQTELEALRSQINPHFLFNSLNSIYGLVMDQEESSGEAVLRLAQVLRYALYDTRAERVPLQRELEHLQQYIELEGLRAAAADIQFHCTGPTQDLQIAPLLLLPLVENGFKHGIKGDTEAVFLHIDINIQAQQLHCTVRNNLGQIDQSLPKTSGIGLQNLRRRLALLYPQKHQLSIESNPDVFTITLQLHLQ